MEVRGIERVSAARRVLGQFFEHLLALLSMVVSAWYCRVLNDNALQWQSNLDSKALKGCQHGKGEGDFVLQCNT